MIGTILIFLFVLSVLVIVHEWGHYRTAKWFGVKVEEFGLGFPPRAFGWKAKDGMIWSLNWIPVGGFVRIKGETGQDRKDKDSFGHKSIFARILILAAGVIMNFLLAVVLFSVAFTVGVPAIVEGDIGRTAIVSDRAVSATEIIPGSSAEEAGLSSGDLIVSVNGEVYTSSEEVRNALESESEGEQFVVVVSHNGEERSVMLTSQYFEKYDRYLVGTAVYETGVVRYPLYLVPIKGIETTISYTWMILAAFVQIIGDLFNGGGVDADVAGPIGIAKATGEVAEQGLLNLLQFGAILSINLAIINILPFPALDGGRILFVLIEAVRRKPNSQKLEALVHNAGFILLMLLIVVVTYKDIVNLIRG